MLSDLPGVLIQMLGIELLADHAIEQRFAQHLNQALPPVADLFAQHQVFSFEVLAI